MLHFPVRKDEVQRLESLHRLEIAGAPSTPELDAVVTLAAEACSAPSALVTLLDKDRQWHMARFGFTASSVPRDHSFCNFTILSGEPMVVENAELDPRFGGNPFVHAKNGLRFYAGVPLALDDGLPLGSLCVIDTKPRSISAMQLERLRQLAIIASALLQRHKEMKAISVLSDKVTDFAAQVSEQSRELALRNRMLDEACALGEIGAFEHDFRTDRLRWNETLRAIHDLGEDEIRPADDFSHLRKFYSHRDLTRYVEAVREAEKTGEPLDLELILRTAKGRKRWVRLRAGFEYENGEAVRRFGMIQDVSRQRRLLRRLEYFANRDSLTGLYNRNYFLRNAESFLNDRPEGVAGIAVVDLDNFKAVNDSYGHAAGDACLKAVARRLRSICVQEETMLMRPGGDEFTVVFLGQESREAAGQLFERLRREIKAPIEWKEMSFEVSASIGLAFCPEDGAATSALDLVQKADLAVYEAKRSGRNRVSSYYLALHRTVLDEFNLISKARLALENGEFELFYQPKIGFADRSLTGFEALLRWRQPDGSYLAPGAFLPVLHDAELSRRIGAHVINLATAQARTWRQAGFHFGHIAVNIAPRQFEEGGFVPGLLERMESVGLAPTDIQIEVTEDVLLSTGESAVSKALKALADAGITIAFDDFGTGYASLVHLRQFEIDVIKLDMSFVKSMLVSDADMAIVQSVLMLASRLGKVVVAEGVETETQFETLRDHGCQYAQGYLFSPPRHPDAVLKEWALEPEPAV